MWSIPIVGRFDLSGCYFEKRVVVLAVRTIINGQIGR